MENGLSGNRLSIILALTVLALVPEYIARSNLKIAVFLYNKVSTYLGDLWYCWSYYFSVGFSYPREYPSGIQLLFKLLFLIPGIKENYSLYMAIISSILALVAIGISLLLYQLVIQSHGQIKRIWVLWLLSPSYLICGLLNLDFFAIITMLLSYFYFIRRQPIYCGIWLAIGATVKVFPIFLLPVFFLSSTTSQKKQLLLSLFITWIAINLPFLLCNFQAWAFPYMWQMQDNYARTMHDGSWFWLVFQLFDHFGIGPWSGKVSLLLFGFGYIYIMYKYDNLPLTRKLVGIMLLFLLTDRVYSPQYNLYLLPFLVLVDYKVDWKYFYLLEIPNFLLILFCFYIKDHPALLQLLIGIKYIALIMLFRNNWATPVR